MLNAPEALDILCVPQLNWSHFKPKYSGKPDEDAEEQPTQDEQLDEHTWVHGPS